MDLETGAAAEVAFSETDHDLLCRQMTRCVESGGLDLFARWLSAALASSLPSMADYNLRPPSDAQVTFAMAISRTLGVTLTSDVLKYRGAMHDFLSAHIEAFDARKRTGGASVTDPVPRSGA